MPIFYLFLIPIYLLNNNIVALCSLSASLYIISGILNYKKRLSFTFIDIWNFGFIYIVISEIVLIKDYLILNGLDTVKFILITNALINIGFYLRINQNNSIEAKVTPSLIEFSRSQIRIINCILIVLSIVFFSTKIGDAVSAFNSTRAEFLGSSLGGGSIISSFISSIGTTVPVISAYFLRYHQAYKNKLYFIIILLLIVTPQFFWGTRYVLLYSFLAPLILLLDFKKLNPKKVFLIIFVFLLLVFSSKYILESRGNTSSIKHESFSEKLASYGSNEGIVAGTLLIKDYIDKNGLSYGKESIFPLYFWFPRKFWKDKPTQLSYWLPRVYNYNLSDAYSGAYGYWGELMMDFSYFSLPLFLFLGIIFSYLEKRKAYFVSIKSFRLSFYYILLGGTFFAVRSPQTVLVTLSFSYLLYFIIKKYILKRYEKTPPNKLSH